MKREPGDQGEPGVRDQVHEQVRRGVTQPGPCHQDRQHRDQRRGRLALNTAAVMIARKLADSRTRLVAVLTGIRSAITAPVNSAASRPRSQSACPARATASPMAPTTAAPSNGRKPRDGRAGALAPPGSDGLTYSSIAGASMPDSLLSTATDGRSDLTAVGSAPADQRARDATSRSRSSNGPRDRETDRAWALLNCRQILGSRGRQSPVADRRR
jgi:hypothetical protein